MTDSPRDKNDIEIPPFANEHARYFGVSNECLDETHAYGVHRHGAARFVRWAPESTQRYEANGGAFRPEDPAKA